MTTENLHLNNLMQIFNLNALIKTPTCYQSCYLHVTYMLHVTCIDNILTNQKALFKLSKRFQTGLSYHHKLIPTIMKSGTIVLWAFHEKKFIDLIKILILII